MSEQSTDRLASRWPGTGFWLFLVLTAVYLLSYSGSFHAIDEVSVAAMTESLVKHGRVTTNQIAWSLDWTPSQGRVGPDGHLYSKKGVGSALLGAPFYWLALTLPRVGAVQALMVANAIVTALTGYLVYACVLRLGFRCAVAVLTALGFGLGTMAWPYAKYFFSEPLTALGLMLGLWGLLAARDAGRAEGAALAGIGLGMALLAKVANAITWPLFLVFGGWVVLQRLREGRAAKVRGLAAVGIAILLPLAAAVLVLAWYNSARTGHLVDLGYAADETFSTPLWYGLAGLLVSPGKSLFLYSPILVAALFGIPCLLRRDRAAAVLSLSIIAAYLLLYARWFMWWGGWSWGPRFLVPILPFLSLFLAPVLDWVLQPSRWWAQVVLALLMILSLMVQILGVAVDFNRYYLLLYQRGLDSGAINFSARLSPLVGHLSLLRSGIPDLAWAARPGPDWPRLLWPLALGATALLGWGLARRPFLSARDGTTRAPMGRAGRWLLGLGGLGLLLVSIVGVARLPSPETDWQAGGQALSEFLAEAGRPTDGMIVDLLPYADHLGLTTSLMNLYKASPAYWSWARQEPVSAERQALLASLGQAYRRLWLVLDTTPEADAASTTERWLDEHAFRVEQRWLSPDMRLVLYGLLPEGMEQALPAPLGLRLGDHLRLTAYSLGGVSELHAGEILPVSLLWQAQQPVDQDYSVFLQLLDQQGKLRVQVDRQPVGGFRPTTTWQPGEQIRDNYGLQLPSDLPAGRYQLIAGLYQPVTMERLLVSDPNGHALGDYALVTTVQVLAGQSP